MYSVKQYIGFIIIFFHIIFSFCILLFPYITNNSSSLLIIILINTTIITQWYIFKGCLISPIEKYFFDDNTDTTKNYIIKPLELFFGEYNTQLLSGFILLFNSYYSGYKIFLSNNYIPIVIDIVY